jgi:hypothetical protein
VGGDAQRFLDAIVELGRQGRSDRSYPVIVLEGLGMDLGALAGEAGSDRDMIARLAARAFVAAGQLDPTMEITAGSSPSPVNSARWRKVIAYYLLLRNDTPQFTTKPELYMEESLIADELYSQEEAICSRRLNSGPELSDQARKDLTAQRDESRTRRETLRSKVLVPYLPKAIENVKKDNPEQAKAWQEQLDALRADKP